MIHTHNASLVNSAVRAEVKYEQNDDGFLCGPPELLLETAAATTFHLSVLMVHEDLRALGEMLLRAADQVDQHIDEEDRIIEAQQEALK